MSEKPPSGRRREGESGKEGERIATPVCALVRNDRLEMRSEFAEVRRYFALASARVVEDADPYDATHQRRDGYHPPAISPAHRKRTVGRVAKRPPVRSCLWQQAGASNPPYGVRMSLCVECGRPQVTLRKEASQSLPVRANRIKSVFPATCRQNGLAPRRSRAQARRLCIRAPILPLQIKAHALIW